MVWIIAVIALAVSASILFLGTFNPQWVFSDWVRIALRLFTVSTLAALSLMIVLSINVFVWRLYWTLYTVQMLCLGMSASILLLFFLTGEAKRGFDRQRKNKTGAGVDPASREQGRRQ
jgi:hypothetical protein